MHLLKIDLDKGHFNNTDRYKSIQEKAQVFSFFVKCVQDV